jgi:hypothetical protein
MILINILNNISSRQRSQRPRQHDPFGGFGGFGMMNQMMADPFGDDDFFGGGRTGGARMSGGMPGGMQMFRYVFKKSKDYQIFYKLTYKNGEI